MHYGHDYKPRTDNKKEGSTAYQHILKCTRCQDQIMEDHKIIGGVDSEHKCSICGATASDYPGSTWSKYHYFAAPVNSSPCRNPKCNYTLTETRKLDGISITNYPQQLDYYMIGSGVDWEKKASKISVSYNTVPYLDKECSPITSVIYHVDQFRHHNWEWHCKTYSEYHNYNGNTEDPGRAQTSLPEENIRKPMKDWTAGEMFAQFDIVADVPITLSGSGKEWSATIPNTIGHGRTNYVEVNGTRTNSRNHLFITSNCTPDSPNGDSDTDIMGYVKVLYRDREGNKIPGAPADAYMMDVAWTHKDSGKTITVKADHENLDRLAWRFVGSKKITGLVSNPPVSGANGPDVVSAGPLGLGKRLYTIVFVYEPIMLQIKHYVTVGNDKILIDTTKNTVGNGIEFHDVCTKTADPNHNCKTTGCTVEVDDGREYVTKHIVTSLNKYIWPGYILLGWNLNTVKGINLVSHEYDLIDTKSLNATTFLDTDPILEEVQKKIEVYTELNKKEKVGFKSDMIIEFDYSTITINVSHHDMSGDYMRDEIGNNLGPASMILTGVSFYIPSLVTIGTNIWGLTGQVYNAEGYLIKEVKVFNGQKQLGTWGPVEPTYFWAFTSCGGAVGPDILQEIQQIGNDKSVKFYYESLENEVIVKHQDTNGTPLAQDEHYPMISTGVDVMPRKELIDSGWQKHHYERDGEVHEPPYDSVHVENHEGKTTIVFVYVKDPPPPTTPPPDPNFGTSYNPDPDAKATVLLKSNIRGNEEYNVENSIPTSEDLYGNIFTNSFILKNEYKLKTITVPLQIKLIKRYYDTNNTDEGEDIKDIKMAATPTPITVDVPIQYYSSEDCILEILNNAIMKDDAMQAEGVAGDGIGKATIIANYTNIPHFDYTKGGQIVDLQEGTSISDVVSGPDGQLVSFTYTIPEIDHREPDMAQIAKEYSNAGVILDILSKNNAKVKMDTTHVIKEDGSDWVVLSGAELPLARTYTVTELKNSFGCTDLADPTPWTGDNVLYRNTDMWVQKTVANSIYATFADIYFKQYQKIGESGVVDGDPAAEATSYLDVPGNNVTVHTPVVNYATLDLVDNNKHNQLANPQPNTIVMGETFKINIPNNGLHKDAPGYGDKLYNFNGLLNADESEFKGHPGLTPGTDSFAKQKQVKFDFGILYNDKYYAKNTWIDLDVSNETFEFKIPTWEDEVWNGTTTKIYTRVIAENATDASRVDASQVNANTDIVNYVSTQDFDVKVIGKMYDIEIRATDDPGWKDFKDGALKANRFPAGQQDQNSVPQYKYGLKMGSKAYFDLKVDGSTGQTSNEVVAIPKYYYVSKEGGEAQEVDLYYHTLAERYVSLEANPIQLKERMAQNYGAKYFANYNTNLGITRRLLGNTIDYTVDNDLGTTSRIVLNNITRIVAYGTSQELIKARWDKDAIADLPEEDRVINSIGRWYGQVKVPASTVVVQKGTNISDVKKGAGVLKNGYLIVAFDKLVTLSNNAEYLSYAKPDTDSQWNKEEYIDEIYLPNGNVAHLPASAKDNAVVLYETDIRINNDFEGTGTH